MFFRQQTMIVFWGFLILCLYLVQAQFPRDCITTEALEAKSCCPLWKDGSKCGRSSGRGECRTRIVPVNVNIMLASLYDDDRLDWPRFYFSESCECFGKYSGYNCGECKYGYYGHNCARKHNIVRKEIRELSFHERKKFFSYLVLAKVTKSEDFVILSTGDRYNREAFSFVDVSVYDLFAWIHYYSIKPILKKGNFDDNTNYAHEGPAFPGWHRLGLLFLERQIQYLTGDEDFAIPYYDWRGEESCSICNDDFIGKSNKQGFLSKYSHFAFWKSMCSGYNYDEAYCLGADDLHQMEELHRKPGANPKFPTLPTFQDVEHTLELENFDTHPYNRTATKSFRNALEGFLDPSDGVTHKTGMHNLVHNFFGGTMGEVPISANDPAFILHHSYIDKIFEEWIHRHNGTSAMYPKNDQPGQGPDECCTPYFPCYKNKDLLTSSTHFGYVYSNYQDVIHVAQDPCMSATFMATTPTPTPIPIYSHNTRSRALGRRLGRIMTPYHLAHRSVIHV